MCTQYNSPRVANIYISTHVPNKSPQMYRYPIYQHMCTQYISTCVPNISVHVYPIYQHTCTQYISPCIPNISVNVYPIYQHMYPIYQHMCTQYISTHVPNNQPTCTQYLYQPTCTQYISPRPHVYPILVFILPFNHGDPIKYSAH